MKLCYCNSKVAKLNKWSMHDEVKRAIEKTWETKEIQTQKWDFKHKGCKLWMTTADHICLAFHKHQKKAAENIPGLSLVQVQQAWNHLRPKWLKGWDWMRLVNLCEGFLNLWGTSTTKTVFMWPKLEAKSFQRPMPIQIAPNCTKLH